MARSHFFSLGLRLHFAHSFGSFGAHPSSCGLYLAPRRTQHSCGSSGLRSFTSGLALGPIDASSLASCRSFVDSEFGRLGLDPRLVGHLASQNIVSPTEVQAKAVPLALSGGDVILRAETGSGKTLAYTLPTLTRVLTTDRTAITAAGTQVVTEERGVEGRGSPRVLILQPNKELCEQVTTIWHDLLQSAGSDLVASTRLDGVGQEPDILVTTPASLSGELCVEILSGVEHVVLDEADMLLSGSHERVTTDMLARFLNHRRRRVDPASRTFLQFVFAGATLPNYGLKSVQGFFSHRFPHASWVSTTLAHCPNPELEMTWSPLPATTPASAVDGGADTDDEPPWVSHCLELASALREREYSRSLVFVNSSDMVHDLHEEMMSLLGEEMMLGTYDGNLSATQRRNTLSEFMAPGQVPKVLFCTDLAARGIDFRNVGHVVQFEFAQDVVSYLHRIGRTARAQTPGKVTNFFSKRDELLVDRIRGAGGQHVESAFSRKRSLRKKTKKAARGPRRIV